MFLCSGVARKPPVGTLDQLRMLNQSLQLGNKLCRSRNPDFLLDIIQRQGTSQSMAWLADLVETSEGSLDVLPVQCLCEFLLHDSPPDVVGDDEENTPGKMKRLQVGDGARWPLYTTMREYYSYRFNSKHNIPYHKNRTSYWSQSPGPRF